MRNPRIDITGYQYGDYTVIEYVAKKERWLVRCKCGARLFHTSFNIRTGILRQHCNHTVEPVMTAAENAVAQLVALSLSNQEIANRLSISYRTVQTHISNIFSKFNLSSRTELAMMVVSERGETVPTQPRETITMMEFLTSTDWIYELWPGNSRSVGISQEAKR